MKRMKASKPARRGVRLSELSTPTEEVVEVVEEPVVKAPVVEKPKPKPKASKPKKSKAKKSVKKDASSKKTI